MSSIMELKSPLGGHRASRGLRLAAAIMTGLFLSFELLARWQERARQRYDLQALDDRQLRDIGLSRADVELECQKRFWMP